MCGIAAIFAHHSSAPEVNEGELVAIRDRMAARGPDGAGLWFDPERRVGFGHRRLSIIDVSAAGAQPMALPEENLVITFNGEIYNYRELRAELQARGCTFRSQSDTEVLLHLYAQHGEAMLDKLRGMFAFALWNGNNRSLFLARDPFGIKPLYWADDGKVFRAASQVKALLAGGKLDQSPEPAGHVGYFLWGHVPSPYTLYRGIRSLSAGHCLTVTQGGEKRFRNYCSLSKILSASEQPAVTSPAATASTIHDHLRSAMSDTVRHHLIADVPVGIFLSAGLDSTTLAALASEQGGELRTVTLGFEEFKGTANDETLLAGEAASHYGAKHQTVWVTRKDFEQDLPRLLRAMDQPTSDGVNSYFISRAAAQAGLKVALSGLGGDELFGGYPSFREVPAAVTAFGRVPFSAVLGGGVRIATAPLLKRLTSPKYAGLLEYGGTYGGAYLLRRGMFMPWELPEILDADLVREGWNELQTLARLECTVRDIRSPQLKISALEMSWYMRHQLLRDTDWASMDHSLEIRVPLVDVALLRSVAPLLSRDSRPTKRDMALTPRSPLPASVLDRRKTGFQVPVRRWLMEAEQKADAAGHEISERGLRGWTRIIYRHFAREAGFEDLCLRQTSPALKSPRPAAKLPAAVSAGKNVVVLLSDGFGGFGGIAKFNRDLLNAICAHSQVGRVLAIPRLIQEPVTSLPPKLDYVTIAANHKARFLTELVKQTRAVQAARPADLIVCAHINLLPAAFFARSAVMARSRNGTRPPIVLMIHGIDAWQRTAKPTVDYFAKRVDAFVAVSDVTRSRFIAWTGIAPEKGFVLPNCVELSRFAAGPKNLDLLQRYQLQDRKILLTFGRLHPAERYKGIDEVLEILGDLKREIPNLAYLIVGDGEDRPRFEQKVARLGLQGTVVFAGRVSEDEKADHYRLADAYVMPGHGEGFGIVYLEAMACGIPVIASKTDGSREAVRDGALGRLVDPANPAELKTAILQTLATVAAPELRRPPAGLEYFSAENFQQRCHQILEKLWGKN